jgi:uncharacterized protein (DUF1778 family)
LLIVAGIPLTAELVHTLADLVDEPAASTLRTALDADRIGVALTLREREQVLRALDDPPSGLTELRRVLLREHEWRVGEGPMDPE